MKRSKDILDQRLAKIATAPRPAASGVTQRRKDARRSERRTIFKPAVITYGQGAAAQCVVNNISAEGARIAIDRADRFPAHLALKFGHGAPARHAEIIWSKNGEYGLSFTDMAAPRATR